MTERELREYEEQERGVIERLQEVLDQAREEAMALAMFEDEGGAIGEVDDGVLQGA